MLIAIEGIDQAGKATQTDHLCSHLRKSGYQVLRRNFPEYGTPIGREIAANLRGERNCTAEGLQLLCAANRFEFKHEMTDWSREKGIVVCDRYIASGIAYGTASGLAEEWIQGLHGSLPIPDLTIFLNISVQSSLDRKRFKRDVYESNARMLQLARMSYLEQSEAPSWIAINGEPEPDRTAEAVRLAVENRLGQRHRPAP